MNAPMLAVSVALLIAGARFAAMLWPRWGHDRYWIGVGAVFVQIGVVSMATSAAHAFAAPAVLGTQAVLVSVLGVLARRRAPRTGPSGGAGCGLWRELSGDWVAIVFALAVLLFIVASGMAQALTPITGIDERNYHGPVMLYWLQNRSTFPFPTHNLRQTLFPQGTELIAVWPLLFERQEWLARMAFWLCLPLGAGGVWSVCRSLALPVRPALAAVAVWCATPSVLAYAESLKSDAWVAVFLLGSAYWLCSARPAGERPGVRFLLAGVFLALAANCKITSLGVLPAVLAIAALGVRGWGARLRAMAGTAAGLLGGALASGLAVVLVYATVTFGHPLGPRDLREIVRAQPGLSARATLLVRVPFFLAEVPEAWSEPMRAGIERAGAAASKSVGAWRLLKGEEQWPYPGRFEYRVAWVARGYSLGGALWLPMLGVAGIWCLRRELLRSRPIGALSACALMSGCLLLAIAGSVRWMGGGPNRFWLGAYALSVPVTAAILARWARSPLVAAAICLGAVWMFYPSLRNECVGVSNALAKPQPPVLEPYDEVIGHLSPGAEILLIAGNTTREWGLFDPAHGFPNRVWSWAAASLDPRGVTSMLERLPITDVVLERDTVLGVNWSGGERIGPVVDVLRSRPDLVEVPLSTPGMRLFHRRAAPETPG